MHTSLITFGIRELNELFNQFPIAGDLSPLKYLNVLGIYEDQLQLAQITDPGHVVQTAMTKTAWNLLGPTFPHQVLAHFNTSFHSLVEGLDSILRYLGDLPSHIPMPDMSTISKMLGGAAKGATGAGITLGAYAGLKEALFLIGKRLDGKITTKQMASQIIQAVLSTGAKGIAVASLIGAIAPFIPAGIVMAVTPVLVGAGLLVAAKAIFNDLPKAFWNGLSTSQKAKVKQFFANLWNSTKRTTKAVLTKAIDLCKNVWNWLFQRPGWGLA